MTIELLAEVELLREKVSKLEAENKALKEKQIPAKPIKNYKSIDRWSCKICGFEVETNEDYCWNCGQATDWSGEI